MLSNSWDRTETEMSKGITFLSFFLYLYLSHLWNSFLEFQFIFNTQNFHFNVELIQLRLISNRRQNFAFCVRFCWCLAVTCLYFVSSDFCTDRDTLFHEDFKMEEFIDCFEKQSKKGSAGLVTTVICTDEGTYIHISLRYQKPKTHFKENNFCLTFLYV